MDILIYIFLISTTETEDNRIESASNTYMTDRVDHTKIKNDQLSNEKNKKIDKSNIIETNFSEYTGVRKDPLELNFHSLRYLNRNMKVDDRDINLTFNPIYKDKNGSCKIVGYTEKDSRRFVSLEDTNRDNHGSNFDMSNDEFYKDQYMYNQNISDSDIKNEDELSKDDLREFPTQNELQFVLQNKMNNTSSRRSSLVDSSSQTENINLSNLVRKKTDNIERSQNFVCKPRIYNKSLNSIANPMKSSCTEESYNLNNSKSMTDVRSHRRISVPRRNSTTNFEETLINPKKSCLKNDNRCSLASSEKIYYNSNLDINRTKNNFVNLEIKLVVQNHPENTYSVKIYKRDLYNTINELIRILLKDENQLKNFIRLLKLYIKKNARSSLTKKFKKSLKSFFADDTKNSVLIYLLNLDRNESFMDLLIDNETIIIYHSNDYNENIGKLKESLSEKSKEFVIYENNQKISLYYLVVHTLLNHLNKRGC